MALAALAWACSGDGDGPPAPTPTLSPPSITTPAPSPSPDPLLDPEPDGARAVAHVRALSVDVGPRLAGTPGELRAIEYIRAELTRYGYDVSVQDFPFDASSYLPARIDVSGTAFHGFAFNGSAEGSVTAPLVMAGDGRAEDFPAGGLNGAIALIARGGVPFQDKVDNAAAAGAGGVVIYNNVDRNLLAPVTTSLPVIGVRSSTGEALRGLAAAAPPVATIAVTAPRGTAHNIIARPPGAAGCQTVSGGHFDSVAVTGGADDNASGTAAVLELARVVAANHEQRANCFVLFGAEEFGLLGSKAYVQALTLGERNTLRGMINLDVVGTSEDLVLIGDDALVDTARIAGEGIGIDASRGVVPNGAGSDHQSFISAGIPAVFFYRNDDLIHTSADTVDRIAPESLAETVRIAYATLLRIAR